MRIGIYISSILAFAATSSALNMQAFSSKLTPLGLMTDADSFTPLDGHANSYFAQSGAHTETQTSSTAEETLDAAGTSSIDSLF